MTKAELLLAEVRQGWRPPKQLSVSDWADQYFKLSPEYAAEAGDWKTHSFQREPLDTVSDPDVWQTVIRSCTQLLKTTVIQIGTAYVIDRDPGPILIIQPRDDDAKAFSKERIAPMLRDVPCLRGKVSESKSKTSANTIEEKWFQGGLLACTSAGSPGNLARRAIRFLFCDEEDKWVISSGSEGKPFALALKRTATFRHRKKAIRCCSPTSAGSSIDKAYSESDMREFYVPCIHCGHSQSMMRKFRTQARWSDDHALTAEQRARTALYYCESCDQPWSDYERHTAVENGHWKAHAQFSGIAGFWISELYSPWKQLWEIVLDWLKAQGDREAMISFVNTSLAENWEEPGEQLDYATIIQRREDYPVGTVPAGGLFLAASVDVQREDGGRLEVRVNAYGENRERWAVDYRIFPGDPTNLATWEPVESMLQETWPTPSGAELPIERMFVDSGDGVVTPFVYEWVKRQPRPRVWAIKGDSRSDQPVGQPKAVEVTTSGKKIKFGILFKLVNSDYFKSQFFADLQKRPPTPEELVNGMRFPQGYCHIPIDSIFGDEHAKQLCSERLVVVQKRNGKRVSQYEKIRSRNEALDTWLYCDAAAWDYGLHRWQPKHWELLRRKVKSLEMPSLKQVQSPLMRAPAPTPAPAERKAARPRSGRDWIPRGISSWL